ncbi:ferredoxin [Candidatus Pyrohabitans sp.]
MIPVVDQRACTGCGRCEQLCPEVFRLINGRSNVVNADACDECDCEAVLENCTPRAIAVYEDF